MFGVLVPNCPVPICPGAKLSGCQIDHFYYLGAKLSAFIILVPNCPLYYLGAKLSGAKLSLCLSIFFCLSVFLSFCLFVVLSFSLSASMSFHLSDSLPFCLIAFLF